MVSNAWKCLESDPPCQCSCHAISAGRRASTKAARRLWTPGMDNRLRSGIQRGYSIKLVAEKLHVTTRQAADRLQEIGESTRTGWRTRHEFGLALGVTWRATARWQADGSLPVERYGAGRWWKVKDDDAEAFVKRHAGVLFDPSKVRDPALKRLAEVSALVNRRGSVAAS